MVKVIIGFAILIFLTGIFAVSNKNDTVQSAVKSNNDSYLCKDCNVILITMTNLGYDHLSQNGYFRPTSPNLDALAKKSIVFDNAFSHSSWTLPESMSIFTSLYPYQHGIISTYDGSVLPQDTPTLIDILNDNGYKTAAFTGGLSYSPEFGLTNRYGELQICKNANEKHQREGIRCAAPKALDWIKNNIDTKFFVHLQGFDAHCPFVKEGGYMYDDDYGGTVNFNRCLWTFDRVEPEIIGGKAYYFVRSSGTGGRASIPLGEEDINHLIALYDESITRTDEVIGSFLDGIKELGLYDNTIIIFTSEHGDMFGKYGRFMRGGYPLGTFYDDVLHVPFFIKHPKINPSFISGLVGQIDIMPTLFDFLSIKKEPSLEGKTLIPLIFQNEEVNQYIFAGVEHNPGGDNNYLTENTRVEAVRSKKWKLIKETIFYQDPPSSSTTFELYDIKNDKEELHNLAPSKEAKEAFVDLKSQLSNWSEKMRGSN